MRAIIPEANFWTPRTPFLYHAVVELWQGDQRCDVVKITRGLRTIQLGPQGMRINGSLTTIRGLVCKECSEEKAYQLYQRGYNTLVVPITTETAHLAELGDRYGFLVLGQLTSMDQISVAQPLAGHPCWLGWLLTTPFLQDPLIQQMPELATAGLSGYNPGNSPLVGVELLHPPLPSSLPPGLSFVVCPKELISALEEVRDLPAQIIILGETSKVSGENETRRDLPGHILGWIELNS
jgi:hypothetical protein